MDTANLGKKCFYTNLLVGFLSGIYKPPDGPDGIGDSLCVKDLTCPLTFPHSVLMKKRTCREISRGMCPTVIKLKIVFYSDRTSTRIGF